MDTTTQLDGLKPYAEYRNSGQAWLGAVPAHWETPRAKLLYREEDERSITGTETLCSVSHKTGVTPRKANVTMFMADSTVGYKICRPDDLVINTLWAWMAALGVARDTGVVSPAYGVYRPKAGNGLNPRYADTLLRIEQYKHEYIARSTGVNASRLRLYPEQFLQIPIVRPPPDEQAAIVRFLGVLDRRVNRLVRAKRRLIELLTEQKQALITHAVTRGLNPDAKRKPSGIDWLGDVPEHWGVTRLSAVAAFANGKAHEQFVDPSGEFVCVTARFVSTGGQHGRPCTKNFFPAMTGDVLMVMSDLPNGRALARAYLVQEDNRLAVNQRVCRLRSISINPEFLCYYANRNVQLLRNDDGWNQTHLSNSDFKTMRVLVPPVSEQAAIVSHLDAETRTADVTIKAAEREITLIREYRTRMVSDVVTGKLDVRAATRSTDDEFASTMPIVQQEEDEDGLDVSEDELIPAGEVNDAEA